MNETIVASIASAATTLVVMLLVVLKIRKHPENVQAEIDAEKQRSENALAIARAKEENLNRRLEDKDESCRQLLASKDEACARALSERDEACRKFVEAQADACEKAKQELIENCRATVEEKDASCKRLLAEKDDAYLKAVKEHIASVRKHMDELADKDYIKKVRGSQGYILMYIPNEGSYLLAMEHDRKLATDAFRRHVIIVNPTTLLLCLQIVALLRSREAQNENAEKISIAAARMYEKFVGFSDTFSDIGKRIDGLMESYRKANGQLCEGNANVVRQLERLKEMGIVTTKTINHKMLEDAMAVDT